MIPEPQIRSKRLPVGEDRRLAGRTDGRLTAAESSADRQLEAPHTNGFPAASLPFGFFPNRVHLFGRCGERWENAGSRVS